MKRIKRFSLTLTALLLFSATAIVTPASARGDTNASSNDSSSSGSGDTAADTGNGKQLSEQFKLQAKDRLLVARQNAKEQTEQHRQQTCEARKTNLTKRMNNAVRYADNHKAVIDKIYTRVQNFYTSKHLNVSDYDTLKANVDAAQSKAADSITALKSLDVSVDCSSQTVADSVSAFQQAISSTRDSLKAYRKALVDLINSLKGASTGAKSNTDTGTNTTTTE